jgi:hypothetical protein
MPSNTFCGARMGLVCVNSRQTAWTPNYKVSMFRTCSYIIFFALGKYKILKTPSPENDPKIRIRSITGFQWNRAIGMPGLIFQIGIRQKRAQHQQPRTIHNENRPVVAAINHIIVVYHPTMLQKCNKKAKGSGFGAAAGQT